MYIQLHFIIYFIDKDGDLLLNVHLTELVANKVLCLALTLVQFDSSV